MKTGFFLFVLIFYVFSFCFADETKKVYLPNEYGVAVMGAHTYGPIEDIGSVMLIGFIQFDYDKIWRHWAPDNLTWRLELAGGMTTYPYQKSMVSLGMVARYYFTDEPVKFMGMRPFAEIGIGGIYTDYKIKGQGLNYNFNPQAGVGFDFKVSRHKYFFAARYHHASNANLYYPNDGINNLGLFLGYYF